MRTAHYKILCTHDVRSGKWSGYGRVVDTCKSLAHDGFDYQVTLRAENENRALIIIRGTAGNGKPKRRARTRPTLAPPVPGLELCRKRAKENRTRAIRPGILPPDKPFRYTDDGYRRIMERKAERRRIGRAVARAKARGESTLPPEVVYGDLSWISPGMKLSPVTIESAIEREKRHNYEWPDSGYDLATRREFLREYNYWRELESLHRQRDHWKPGLTDETMYQDDEVLTEAR